MFKVYLEKANGVRIFEFIFSCIFTPQHAAQQTRFDYVNTTPASNWESNFFDTFMPRVMNEFSNFSFENSYMGKLKI